MVSSASSSSASRGESAVAIITTIAGSIGLSGSGSPAGPFEGLQATDAAVRLNKPLGVALSADSVLVLVSHRTEIQKHRNTD